MAISDGIPAVPRKKNSRNSVPNPSAEEKTTWNSIPLNKNISKLSEFPSERFSGREKNSEFRSVEQKKKNTLGIPFRTLPRKRKKLGIPFRTIPRKRNYLEQNAAAQILKIVSEKKS
jgi:hypothetical protein